jgi:hypothetical protein
VFLAKIPNYIPIIHYYINIETKKRLLFLVSDRIEVKIKIKLSCFDPVAIE